MKEILRRAVAVTVLLTLFATGVSNHASALDVPPRPVESPVVDLTNTLSEEQKNNLGDTIAKERQETGNQIAVLMIPSLEGEILEDYSLDVARSWGIGQKERDSGVLLFIAKDDRQMRIEVGYGLEGALTDIRSGQIIRDRIAPEFRQGQYYEGIRDGLDGIVKAIHNEADPNLKPGTSEIPLTNGMGIPALFFVGFTLLSWLGAILGRSKRWWPGGAIGGLAGIGISMIPGFFVQGIASAVVLALFGLLFDKMVSSNYKRHTRDGIPPSWWAGGGGFGGGSRGGGFGGFGGGGFGGGGASGRW